MRRGRNVSRPHGFSAMPRFNVGVNYRRDVGTQQGKKARRDSGKLGPAGDLPAAKPLAAEDGWFANGRPTSPCLHRRGRGEVRLCGRWDPSRTW